MMKVLIIYATREGQTEKVANRIAMHLRNLSTEVQVVNARNGAARDDIDLDTFDHLVIGGSLHAGGIEKELVNYVSRHKAQIESKNRSFFLVLLSAATKDPELKKKWLADARRKLDQQLAVHFEDPELIAGALIYSKYSFPVKWIMKRIAKKAGQETDTSKDYEYTDWKQVERFAEKLI